MVTMDDDGGAGGDDHHHGHQIMMQLSFSCHSCYHMLSLELYTSSTAQGGGGSFRIGNL